MCLYFDRILRLDPPKHQILCYLWFAVNSITNYHTHNTTKQNNRPTISTTLHTRYNFKATLFLFFYTFATIPWFLLYLFPSTQQQDTKPPQLLHCFMFYQLALFFSKLHGPYTQGTHVPQRTIIAVALPSLWCREPITKFLPAAVVHALCGAVRHLE